MTNNPLDKLTLEQIKQLREKLLTKMLFEPIADPGFQRDTEKLRYLVISSKMFYQRLREYFYFAEDIAASIGQIEASVEKLSPQIEWLKTIELETPSTGEGLQDGVAIAHHSQAETGCLSDLDQLKNVLLMEADRLWHSGLEFPLLVGILLVQLRRKQLEANQLGAFLYWLTESVSKGKPSPFEQEALPEGASEALSDLADLTLDKLEIPNLTPSIRLLFLVLNYIRRGEMHVEEEEKMWAKFEKKIFLSAYYDWWSDGKGHDSVKDLVEDCVRSVEGVRTGASNLAMVVVNFTKEWENFQTLRHQYIALYTQQSGQSL
jgi:hypothetical protein